MGVAEIGANGTFETQIFQVNRDGGGGCTCEFNTVSLIMKFQRGYFKEDWNQSVDKKFDRFTLYCFGLRMLLPNLGKNARPSFIHLVSMG